MSHKPKQETLVAENHRHQFDKKSKKKWADQHDKYPSALHVDRRIAMLNSAIEGLELVRIDAIHYRRLIDELSRNLVRFYNIKIILCFKEHAKKLLAIIQYETYAIEVALYNFSRYPGSFGGDQTKLCEKKINILFSLMAALEVLIEKDSPHEKIAFNYIIQVCRSRLSRMRVDYERLFYGVNKFTPRNKLYSRDEDSEIYAKSEKFQTQDESFGVIENKLKEEKKITKEPQSEEILKAQNLYGEAKRLLDGFRAAVDYLGVSQAEGCLEKKESIKAMEIAIGNYNLMQDELDKLEFLINCAIKERCDEDLISELSGQKKDLVTKFSDLEDEMWAINDEMHLLGVLVADKKEQPISDVGPSIIPDVSPKLTTLPCDSSSQAYAEHSLIDSKKIKLNGHQQENYLPNVFLLDDLKCVDDKTKKTIEKLLKLQEELAKFGVEMSFGGGFSASCARFPADGKIYKYREIDVVICLPQNVSLEFLFEKISLILRTLSFKDAGSSRYFRNFVREADSESVKAELNFRAWDYVPYYNPFPSTQVVISMYKNNLGKVECVLKPCTTETAEDILGSKFSTQCFRPEEAHLVHFIPRLAKYLIYCQQNNLPMHFCRFENNNKVEMSEEEFKRYLIEYFSEIFPDKSVVPIPYYHKDPLIQHHLHGLTKIIMEKNISYASTKIILDSICIVLLRRASDVVEDDYQLEVAGKNMAKILQVYFEKNPQDAQRCWQITNHLLKENIAYFAAITEEQVANIILSIDKLKPSLFPVQGQFFKDPQDLKEKSSALTGENGEHEKEKPSETLIAQGKS